MREYRHQPRGIRNGREKQAQISEQDDSENLIEPIPENIRPHLDPVIGAGEEIKISLSTDMTLDGSYGTDWLVATDQQLIALNFNGQESPDITQISLGEIEAVEAQNLFGNNILKLRLTDRGVEVARYTKSLTRKFARASPKIRELIRQSKPESSEQEDQDHYGPREEKRAQRCEQCGRPIPHWAGVCPHCIEKRRLIFRLLNYALPYWPIAAIALLLLLVITVISLAPEMLLGKVLIDRILAPSYPRLELGFQNDLDDGVLSPALRQVLRSNKVRLSEDAVISVEQAGNKWQIRDKDNYTITRDGAILNVRREPDIFDKIISFFLIREENPDPKSLLVKVIVALILINIVTNALGAIRGYMMAWLGQRITYDLRNETYAHLHRLSLNFYNTRETGNIMSRITNDVHRLQDFVAEGLQDMIHNTVMLFIMGSIMLKLNWKLGIFAMLPTPLIVILSIEFGKRMHKVFHRLWRRWAGLSAILADTIPGVRVVKAFAQEEREVDKFETRSYDLFENELGAAKLWTVFGPTMQFVTFISNIIIWLVGGLQVIAGEITLGVLMIFMGFMMRFLGPVRMLSRLHQRFQRAATAAERVFEILDTQPDVADKPDSVELPDMQGRVEFRNVSFSYDGNKKALDGVSFEVSPGEMIGLAGHSGAGKSTLINLICRFYDVDEGAILIDGVDLRDIKVKSLREQIGVVLQDPFLFNGTVAENIAYGTPNATMAEIIAAAKAANAHDFILNFPDGYDTIVGERGARVSGGERQRISIARAILKNPRILILDEATSSVDTETESLIQEALERLIRGRTVFAIAHRLSTLKHANRLLILREGQLDEIGTHDELLEKDGTYAKLCRLQTELSRIRAW